MLQKFDLEIKDKKGSKNLVANHLSHLDPFMRLTVDDEAIHETFPDEHLLVVAALLGAHWYANIVNYLACKVFPPEFKFQEKKRLIVETKQYFWDHPYL